MSVAPPCIAGSANTWSIVSKLLIIYLSRKQRSRGYKSRRAPFPGVLCQRKENGSEATTVAILIILPLRFPVKNRMKHRKINRDMFPWTATQLQNRKRRRMRGYIMRFGMPTPKGTYPRSFVPSAEPPVFKPMPRPSWGFQQAFEAIISFVALLPWMRRRRAEKLRDQRSDAIKAKGR